MQKAGLFNLNVWLHPQTLCVRAHACVFCACVCIETSVSLHQCFAQFSMPIKWSFSNENLRSAISTLFVLPSISPFISCLFLKPCGTRPVCPSQEVWGRMAASWRQTAPKPCMLVTPPSDTPALLWSPPDCPENQKHLPCLNDTQTYRLQQGHTHTCAYIQSHMYHFHA